MMVYAWLIAAIPLLAFVIILLFGRRLQERAAYVGIAALCLSFALATLVLIERISAATFTWVFDWLTIGSVTITMGYQVTALNAMMLFVVTLVSLLVHIFSRDYLHDDQRLHVYYSYLALFSFSMLGLVLAPNILQLFIFWELVGLCSYLLVGFWYFKKEAADAAKKAFLTTRIGDVGLFLGLVIIFRNIGSFEYETIFAAVQGGLISDTTITVIALLLFLGAVGKSAQFPLHVWLPDAMEGPTPVSALIHAATMVAAGVYLVGVMYPLFLASSVALTVVAWTGAITAIFAASIGLVQNDIKRVLAYSTVSQLGFMMLALGTLGYVAGLFHLMTHAFFKALLFLGSGSVIHGTHTQDIREMGGLWKKMPLTAWTFLIGCLAIAGIPPLAGFWSKEEILATVWINGNTALFAIAAITAVMTAFYMFRLFFVTFAGKYRGTHAVHESNMWVKLPLTVLAGFAVVSGFANAPFFGFPLEKFLTTGVAVGNQAHAPLWMIGLSIVIALAGILPAWWMYGREDQTIAPALAVKYPFGYQLLLNKYWIDEFYLRFIVAPVVNLGRILWAADDKLVDGLVRQTGSGTKRIGHWISSQQTGQLQTYGLVTVIGAVVVFALAFVIGGGVR